MGTLALDCFRGEQYITCIHELSNLIENASSIAEVDGTQEAYDSHTYSIPDSIYPPAFELDIEIYNDTINGYNQNLPGGDSYFYKVITRLYRNALHVADDYRLFIDFLYHYQTTIGVIKPFAQTGTVEYYNNPLIIKRNYQANFYDNLKFTLIQMAKITIRDEINYNLQGIYPSYDIHTMAPSWGVLIYSQQFTSQFFICILVQNYIVNVVIQIVISIS